MIERIGYMLREIAFENGGIVERGENVYMYLKDAQQEFNNRVEKMREEYGDVRVYSNRSVAVDECGMRDMFLEIIPTRIHGCHIEKDEVIELIVSKLSGGSLITFETTIDFDKYENYEHCDEMVLIGVFHEYAAGKDENGKIQLNPVYYVYLKLIFKKGNYILYRTHKENIECIDERILDKLYEYVSNEYNIF